MTFRQLRLTWNKWINEYIYVGSSVMPRHAAVYTMCVDGIFPLMKDAGYQLFNTEKKMTKDILYCMFQYYLGSKPSIPNRQNVQQELYEQFHHIFDSDVLCSFWDVWGSIQDFGEDGYAYRFQGELPFIIWNFIDFDGSTVTADILDDPESTEMMRGPGDDAHQDLIRDANVKDRHLY